MINPYDEEDQYDLFFSIDEIERKRNWAFAFGFMSCFLIGTIGAIVYYAL